MGGTGVSLSRLARRDRTEELAIRLLDRPTARPLRRLLAAPLVLALVAGCGGSDDGDPDDVGEQDASVTATTDADASSPTSTPTGSDETAAAAEDGEGAECALTGGEVAAIVGAELTHTATHEVLDGGISCVYEVPDELTPTASVAVGPWDGTDAAVDDLSETNRDIFGEPTATPDLGQSAFLWDDADSGRSVLLVFADGHYYTSTVWGPEPTATRRDMVTEMFQAAS